MPWHVKVRAYRAKGMNVVANCGVYTGKTLFGSVSAFDEMHRIPNEMHWWVAALDFQLRRYWEYFKPMAQAAGWKTKDSPHPYAEAPNGSRIHAVTTKSLDMLAAYHPDKMWVDEGSKITEKAWQLLRVRMIKSQSTLFSTPKPNYWRTLINQAQDPSRKNWGYVHETTSKAGIATPAMVAELKKSLPDELYRQECEAEIVAAAGTVFPHVRSLAVGVPQEPKEGVRYTVTYDPAKHMDFAWVTVWDGLRVVACDMWLKKDYRFQAERVGMIAEIYNHATVIFDRTGPGEAVGEMLQVAAGKRDFSLHGVVFNNTLKSDLVNAAVLAKENGDFVFIDPNQGTPYDEFINQMEAFERSRSSSGLTYTYEAPQGFHDDAVTTVLLRMMYRGWEPRLKQGSVNVQGDSDRIISSL